MTNALFRLAFAMAPTFNLPLLISRRLILQQARSQTLSRPPTACKLIVSCSISLPLRGSFHLSLTVLCAIGHLGIFSLTRWSSQIHTGFHVSHATRDTTLVFKVFNYRIFTFYDVSFQRLRLTFQIYLWLSHNPTF